jgi:hypothetical protein
LPEKSLGAAIIIFMWASFSPFVDGASPSFGIIASIFFCIAAMSAAL